MKAQIKGITLDNKESKFKLFKRWKRQMEKGVSN